MDEKGRSERLREKWGVWRSQTPKRAVGEDTVGTDNGPRVQ